MGQTRTPEQQEGDGPKATDVRCSCGALVARERGGWVEVKCRRCKRGIRLRWDGERLVVEDMVAL
jgi:hypothetical protein